MPLITASIGLATAPMVHEVDVRWTMGYAACLGDTDPVYLDTTRAGGVVAHPLFAGCAEWPVALASRELLKQRGLSEAEFRRGVHATHDTHIDRLVRPGDVLSTVATIVDIEMRKPGAYVTTVFDTHDAAGERVCRTFNGMLLRGVELMSVNKAPVANLDPGIEIPPVPHAVQTFADATDSREVLAVDNNLAHTYTDCARIWNPIHTDVAVARAAGLPDIILHGSATLALAVSAVCRRYAGGDPARVKRVCAQFRGMVLLPSELTLSCSAPRDHDGASIVAFELGNDAGSSVIHQGSVTLA